MNLDDTITQALRDETAEIHPAPDARRRVLGLARPRPSWTTTMTLVAAAAVVLVVAAAAILSGRDDRAPVITDAPATTTTSEPAATTTTSTRTATPPDRPALVDFAEPSLLGDAALPPEVIAVTTDGRIVVIGTESGTQIRDLTPEPDPASPGESPLQGSPTELAVDQRRNVVFVGICCEPAVGKTFALPLTGGAPVDFGFFDNWPEVSPDSSSVAGTGGGVEIRDLGPVSATTDGFVDGASTFFKSDQGESHEQIVWSPNGRYLAAAAGTVSFEPDGFPVDGAEILIFEVATASPEETGLLFATGPTNALSPPQGAAWRFPAFRSDGMLVVAEDRGPSVPMQGLVIDPGTGEVDATFRYDSDRISGQDYDPSGTYLLTTADDGTVTWQGGGRSGTLGNGYSTADW